MYALDAGVLRELRKRLRAAHLSNDMPCIWPNTKRAVAPSAGANAFAVAT